MMESRKRKNLLDSSAFGEEVGYVLVRTDKGHGDQVILHTLANVQVSPLNMFHAPKMLGVVRHVGGRTIVTVSSVTEFSD